VEFVIVFDDDTDPSVLRALERTAGDSLKLVPFHDEFNFAAKINVGAANASGDVLVLLNDDTEVISADWLETLVGLASAPDVGMVGPLLRYPDQTIQAAGHTHDGGMRSLGQTLPADAVGPFALFRVARECMGVTAACAAVRREVFEEAGGMNAALSNSFNDVDLCLKLRHLGYRNIWTPFAELYHFESMTRDPTVLAQHALPMVGRWGVDLLVHDPYGPDPYRTPAASAHEVAGLRALAASLR
jgi:GT2 family glycosyltransferase